MLKNYLKAALRHHFRNRLYTFLNVLGLSVGMASAITIYLYIQKELSYDQHLEAPVYRVTTQLLTIENQRLNLASSTGALAPTLIEEYPTVKDAARIFNVKDAVLSLHNQSTKIDQVYMADDALLEMLGLTLIAQSSDYPLSDPHTVVITRQLAERFFGSSEAALHQTIELTLGELTPSFTVTGVMEVPTSHFEPHMLISFKTVPADMSDVYSWGSINCYTYLTLQDKASVANLEKALEPLFDQYMKTIFEGQMKQVAFRLQPVQDIHLHSSGLDNERANRSDIKYIYALMAVVFFILVVACINYVNLATANASRRAREIGIRKVVGSQKRQLIGQFLTEALLVTFLSFIISLGVTHLFIFLLNNLFQEQLAFEALLSLKQLGILLSGVLLLGGLSGLYPAFVLSRFNTHHILKGATGIETKGALLRKGLTVFQFFVSLTIITITYFTYQQIQYMNQQDLGFDQTQVLVLSIESNPLQDKLSTLKAEIAKQKGVSAITSASAVPGVPGHNTFIADLEKEGEKKSIFLSHYYIDEDYLTTMGVKLIKGRNLQHTRATDTAAVLINETLAKQMGWENPLGKKIEVGENLTVVGVFKDIHISSLHHAITPTILTYEYDHGRHQADQLLIRLDKENLSETLADIQAIWKNFEKKYPFEGYFLDTRFQKQYEQDQRQNKLLTLFSALTVLIACLGLFGLALFTTERRKKEICIRKILGASVKQVYFLVSNRFLVLILLASILSFPTAYIITDGWLQTFAYRIDIASNWFVFVGALGVCLLLSLFTISFQVIKVARVNPVEMLKDE